MFYSSVISILVNYDSSSLVLTDNSNFAESVLFHVTSFSHLFGFIIGFYYFRMTGI